MKRFVLILSVLLVASLSMLRVFDILHYESSACNCTVADDLDIQEPELLVAFECETITAVRNANIPAALMGTGQQVNLISVFSDKGLPIFSLLCDSAKDLRINGFARFNSSILFLNNEYAIFLSQLHTQSFFILGLRKLLI